MKAKYKSESGIVYLIEDYFEEIGEVILDVVYSSGEDDELELEWVVAEEGSNPHLTEDQIEEVNSQIEDGRELEYAQFLNSYYEKEGIKFLTEHEL
jgi:uncharacterized protein YkuJ